jgi:hypothetical protein
MKDWKSKLKYPWGKHIGVLPLANPEKAEALTVRLGIDDLFLSDCAELVLARRAEPHTVLLGLYGFLVIEDGELMIGYAVATIGVDQIIPGKLRNQIMFLFSEYRFAKECVRTAASVFLAFNQTLYEEKIPKLEKNHHELS